MNLLRCARAWLVPACIALASSASAADTALLRATELRADKLPDAAVTRTLAAGTRVDLLSLEGGWAWVALDGVRGWVRASTLELRADPSRASQVASGRLSVTEPVATLGVRSLPPRASRHALIIGVSRYKDPAIAPLPGVKADRESATQMARAMQIPDSNIRYLQDEQATGDAIRKALRELEARAGDGDRVFVHFSGHGTRYPDPKGGGCVEALLAHDGGWPGTLSNREMADLLAPISRKTDKLFVMYDACHSGGVASQDLRTRGIVVQGDEGRLRPKFTPTTEECARPSNVRTRNWLVEPEGRASLPQDVVHLSSSRDNEISFDDELKGGLGTQFMRDCMLRDAVDLDGSGAISIDEVRACAQHKINKRLENDPMFRAHHLVLTGNPGFVPAWFSVQQLAASMPPPAVLAAPAAPASTPVSAPVATPAPPPVATAPPPPPSRPPKVAGQQALEQLHAQRDGKRQVTVTLANDKLKIGRDALDLSVQTDRKGYLYVAMAGSDNESLYVIFPNDLDRGNMIRPGKAFRIPRTGWTVKAGGPPGRDGLLVMVTDAPRDLSPLAASKAGPFVKSLNDARGRAALGALMTRAQGGDAEACRGKNRKPSDCSDAFGAALVEVEEVP